MKNVIRACLFFAVLMNCSKQKLAGEKWQTFSVDKDIRHNPVFKQMDSEKEVQMGIDSGTPKETRSSKVIYDGSADYACRPSLWKDRDTLNIGILNSNGFVSMGFTIRANKNTFTVVPFLSDDVEEENERPSTFTNSKEKLILNKAYFKPNDSVYGYVEFEKTETDRFGNVKPHQGKGYFRGKIEYYK